MKRREILRCGLGAPLVNATSKAQPARTRSVENLPNILWICTDQQRFDTIQGLNNDHIRTPTLRKLMSESVTFTHAFVQNPVCSPSRASFLTGRYPHTTGLRANGQRIRASERLLPRILSDFGYECGLAGKLHLAPVLSARSEDRIDDGYHQFYWSHDLQDIWPGNNLWRESLKARNITWPDPPRGNVWGVPIEARYSQTAWCADMAIQFLRRERQFPPWFFSLNCFQPHHPFWPVKQYLDRYDPEKLPSPAYRQGELESKPLYQRVDHRAAYGGTGLSFTKTDELEHRRITAAYYAMIEQIDTEVGRVLQALEETGQVDRTIVIFSSDHGELLGDHGIYWKGPHFYDCSIRVPLIIRWPGHYRAGLRVDGLVELIDLVPTLLEAAGIPIPPGVQGQSLSRALKGETAEHRGSIYVEHYDSSFLYDPPAIATSVRTRTHKLTIYQSLDTGELYDLERDPGEFRNLWHDPNSRDMRENLTMLLVKRMAETMDPLPVRKVLA